jgi:biopolymer transport protein ExbD
MFARPKRQSHAIDMAPLIDVVFLLLIFFMLTSSFTQPSLPLTLPKASGEQPERSDAIVVNVDATGAITIASESIPLEQFEPSLRAAVAASQSGAVNFRADRAVEYGFFVDLMDRAGRAGASKFNLVHDPRPRE